MRPLFVYDGDCPFCRFWAERWRKRTRRSVAFAPYQKVAHRFAQIPLTEFARAAFFIDGDGPAYRGAAAVLRLWRYRSGFGKLLWLVYRFVPLVARVAERVYDWVSRHRSFLWMLTRMFSSTREATVGCRS